MADTYVFAGAARWPSNQPGGLFRRQVGNGGWEPLRKGLPEGAEVRAIAIHPEDPRIMYAGTQDGPYRTVDRGESWARLPVPGPGGAVWAILIHPRDPRILFIGTSPAAVYRSDDGGDRWRRLPGPHVPERLKCEFPPRVLRMAADPAHPDEVYAGVEIGGVMRSLDGGQSWSDCSADLLKLAELPHLKSRIISDSETEGMLDAHALCVSSAKPGTVFLAVRMGLFRSDDRGGAWRDMEVGRFSPLTYARDVQVSPQDPNVLYACLSPAARSEAGTLYRSQDLGATWQRFDRNVTANATMMALALHRRDPNQVYCASRSGQVFGTQDGGKTWEEHQLPPGVHDVYAVACA